MATTSQPWEAAEAPGAAGDNYLTHSHGIMSWALTLDHKRVGIMFLVSTVLCLFLIGDGLRDAFDPTSVDKK